MNLISYVPRFRWPIVACLLAVAFTGPAQATNVVMKTTLGNIEFELFDDAAPNTVANFINYVESGAYDDTIIHRSVADFVIQGGGYGTDLNRINTDPAIANEFSMPNLRGTIAMAKLAGDPDSATSQWFINLTDNSVPLDVNNGGYTVFGEVSSGMDVVDDIAALARLDLTSITNNGALGSTPVVDDQAATPTATDNLVVVTEAYVQVTTTPEPASGLAALMGLVGLAGLRRRRR